MKKLSVKEVVSSCCNAPITGVNINGESSAWCEKCGKPFNPSETNEATTADKGRQAPITDYLKELRLLCFDYESTKIDSDYFDRLFELTFNDSIERARREERQRVVEMIERMKKPKMGDLGYEVGDGIYGEAITDILSKIKEGK